MWLSFDKTSKSNAEIDFVIQYQDRIYPLEVKSGYSKHKKSLVSFKEKYNPNLMIRFSPRNFIQQGDFVNLPLYAASILRKLLS